MWAVEHYREYGPPDVQQDLCEYLNGLQTDISGEFLLSHLYISADTG
jgi:hypothetical protein